MFNRKNPLIPMAAITGNPTREEVYTIMQKYADAGIQQFLIYPRDGCEVEYMSERWLDLCEDIITAASEVGIDIWLYDEFNWPSGTCNKKVMEMNDDFVACAVKMVDGKPEFAKNHDYADILNPEAVDCFIELTHEVYYKRYEKWFGNTIKGIFTDEPGFEYYGRCPYPKKFDEYYFEHTNRNFFNDLGKPDDLFWIEYYKLLGKLFRETYIDRLTDWCNNRNILLTGHLLAESTVQGSVKSNGDPINVLRGFTLPGMDEICTRTSVETAEWITFGTVQAAIRQVGNGGLAEIFALGPTDLNPSRLRQMIWLCAFFGINHYLMAVAPFDVRGNVKKNGWFHPTNYIQPWFAGYPELAADAMIAADTSKKSIKNEIAIRYPLSLASRFLYNEELSGETNKRLLSLLKSLIRNQYQWAFVNEDDRISNTDYNCVINLTIDNYEEEVTGNKFDSLDELIGFLKTNIENNYYLTELDGSMPDDIFMRKYTDGTSYVLDLRDTEEDRTLILNDNGLQREVIVHGRSVFNIEEKSHKTIQTLNPSFKLELDRANTLRCNFTPENLSFNFETVDKIKVKLLIRDYIFNGSVFIDGIELTAGCVADALPSGISSLYKATEEITLMPGAHTVQISEYAVSEPFLPAVFVSGEFAADNNDILRLLPGTIGIGSLDDTLPQFGGKITYSADLEMPGGDMYLSLDTCGLYTRVFVNGLYIEGKMWKPYVWKIPNQYCNSKIKLRIEQYTSIAPIFGRADDVAKHSVNAHKWPGVYNWFPKKYKESGIKDIKITSQV